MARTKTSTRSHANGTIIANVYRLDGETVLYSYDFSGPRVEHGNLFILLSGSEQEAQERADSRLRKEHEQVGVEHLCSVEACSNWAAVESRSN